MIDPRQIASQLLGAIDWQTEVSGFCRCPGEAFHTSANGKKDCRVNVDGAPTIFCFHASCARGGGGGEPALAPGAGRLALGAAACRAGRCCGAAMCCRPAARSCRARS